MSPLASYVTNLTLNQVDRVFFHVFTDNTKLYTLARLSYFLLFILHYTFRLFTC